MDPNVLKQALIGTDRPFAANSLDGNIGRIESVESLDEAMASDSAAWRLLLKSGCYAVVERAGFEPETVVVEETVAPPDKRPAVPRRVAEIVSEFLKEHVSRPQVPLVFLKRIADAGFRLPNESLPGFLRLFSQRNVFKEQGRETVAAVLGERGRWLAAQNADWRWAAEKVVVEENIDWEKLETLWTDGSFQERNSSLKILRKHDPGKAREKLAETWKNDKAEHRENFLNVFADGLSEADVPFLENALKDRSGNVRQLAANLLAEIPDSEYAKRARVRAEAMIQPGPNPGSFQIVPPTEFTKEMKADAFEEKPPQGVGQRAWWLAETMKRVPLTFWETKFQQTPTEILAVLKKDVFLLPLLLGWSSSAFLFENDDWIEPLWNVFESENAAASYFMRDNKSELLRRCLTRLPLAFAKKVGSNKDSMYDLVGAWSQLTLQQPAPWSDEFSNAFCVYLESSGNAFAFIDFLLMVPSKFRERLRCLIQTDSQIQPRCLENLEICDELDRLLEIAPR